jgi:hypothetical protein
MAVDRKQLLMGGAAVIALVLAVTMLRPAATPARAVAPAAAPQPARARSGGSAQSDPAAPVAPVKLKALSEVREEPGETKRNPFRFQPKFVPPPPKPVTTAPVVTPPPAERTGPPPPPPPIALKFIGVLERANGVKWAVLTDGKTPTPMYGKDGDIIDGRYQIVKIGTESIEMTYADGRGRTVIRLTGQ